MLEIEGVSHATVLTFMSELGPDGIKEFATAKHFSSWLRLASQQQNYGEKKGSSTAVFQGAAIASKLRCGKRQM